MLKIRPAPIRSRHRSRLMTSTKPSAQNRKKASCRNECDDDDDGSSSPCCCCVAFVATDVATSFAVALSMLLPSAAAGMTAGRDDEEEYAARPIGSPREGKKQATNATTTNVASNLFLLLLNGGFTKSQAGLVPSKLKRKVPLIYSRRYCTLLYCTVS